jgi:hypothetical protein
MDYKKCWNTLRAESGGRWCQPHPMSNELLTIGELMRNMERRDSEAVELSKQADNTGSPKLPTLEECIGHFDVNYEIWSDAQRLTHSYVTKVYDYICRQLQANA